MAAADDRAELEALRQQVEEERKALAEEREALADQRRRIDDVLANLPQAQGSAGTPFGPARTAPSSPI